MAGNTGRIKSEIQAKVKKEALKTGGTIFTTEYLQEEKKTDELKNNLEKLRIVDISMQIGMRVAVAIFFGFLLFIQNFEVFSLVNKALVLKSLKDLQAILSIVTSATLAETYLIATKIVEWVLKPIDYNHK
jgi:hypothetical protein